MFLMKHIDHCRDHGRPRRGTESDLRRWLASGSRDPVRGRETRPHLELVIVLIAVGVGAVAVRGAERTAIDLRRGDNLKLLFDAGLRPTRIPGLEKSKIQIGPTQLRIILPDGRNFDVDVERGEFGVIPGNLLYLAELFGVTEPVPRAIERARAICGTANISDAGLEEKANTLGSLPDSDKAWFKSGGNGGVKVSVTFHPVWSMNQVKAQVWVALQWPRAAGSIHSLDEPIQPPPGFEDVSMEPAPPALRPTGTR